MKTRLSTLLVAMGISLFAALPGLGQADDTDLYLNQAKEIDETVRPNILFVLDNSGSMLWDVYDPKTGKYTGYKRIDLLQEALLEVLDDANNVNVGIERFAFKSGKLNTPILYPIKYIDAPVLYDTDGGDGGDGSESSGASASISTSIQSSADDAEEAYSADKSVVLDDNNLDMTYLAPSKDMGLSVVQSAVSDYNDLALEYLGVGGTNAKRKSNGTMFISSNSNSYYKLTGHSNYSFGDAMVGVRIPDLAVPKGAKILAAQLVFTSLNNYGKTKVKIEGFLESDGSVNSFSTSSNDLSDRNVTSESVSWDITSWGSDGSVEPSPDLSSVVQSMVDQANWDKGNAVGFLISRNPSWNESSSSYQSSQGFYGYSSGDTRVPVLRVAYSTKSGAVTGSAAGLFDNMSELTAKSSAESIEMRGNGSGGSEIALGTTSNSEPELYLGNGKCTNSNTKCWGDTLVGIQFSDLGIPAGALITEAYLELNRSSKSGSNPNDDVTVRITLEDSAKAENLDGKYWWGGLESSPNPLFDLSTRAVVNKSVDWAVPNPSSYVDMQSPDMASMFQELVNRSDWVSGNNQITVLISKVDGMGGRRITSRQDYASARPRLVVKWSEMSGSLANLSSDSEGVQQVVGLRFSQVDIPRGVTINSARLEFTSGSGQSDSGTLLIQAHASGDSPEFTATAGSVSDRSRTTKSVNWDVDAWESGQTYDSPDLKEIVQEVVSNAGWCGGRHAMSFLISSSSPVLRNALSYDAAPFSAPKLHIAYDPTTIPDDTCVVQSYSGRIVDSDDDTEEVLGDGDMYPESADLQLVNDDFGKRMVGLRFQDIPIRANTKIISAEIGFKAQANSTDVARLVIQGERSVDSGRFTGENSELSSRKKTTASVIWELGDADEESGKWRKNGEYSTVDISSIVQEIVNQTGWEAYNDMSFFIYGEGLREAIAFDSSPTEAPVLRISIEGMLGEEGAGYSETVRTYLKRVTREMYMEEDFYTPIVDGLYEAALYFRGEEVYGGKDRYNNHHYRISHPLSHNGAVITPAGCDVDTDPYGSACAGEKIESGSHATYISPINSSCQANHIVLLSDGLASQNTVTGNIGSLISAEAGMSCSAVYPGFTRSEYGQNQKCGPEWVEYLHNYDQVDSVSGSTIKTHSVGFMLSDSPEAQKYLKQLATSGGGEYYDADSAQSLVDAFQTIIAAAMTESASFASPAVSVNAYHKLYHDNEVYFSMFKPAHSVAWDGNVKKYTFCSDSSSCTLGSVLDRDGKPIVGSLETTSEDQEAGKILDSISDYWNTTGDADGNTVTAGGAGSVLPAPDKRNIYTNTGGTSNVALTAPSNALKVNNNDLTAALLGVATAEERDSLINWIRGYKADGTVRSWRFGDPLHGSPVIVTYGTKKKVLIATNEGSIRMLDEETGVEDWMFIPQDMLAIQDTLRYNPNKGERVYGIDSTPSILIDGSNTYMFVGMRRGGRNIYGLDISNPSSPKLMWTIEGGITQGYDKLGQTWSRPRPVQAELGGKSDLVLLFGGGYDASTQDNSSSREAAKMGNAIFAADPMTGARVWWAGGPGSGADMALDAMQYAIPSDLALLDSDSNGAIDRIYVGDTGGQVWRLDLNVQAGGVLGSVSGTGGTNSYRRFFYPPDVVSVEDNMYSSTAFYDLVLIESGERFDPLGSRIQNRLYAFRDRALFTLNDADGDNNADQDAAAFLDADVERINNFFTITEQYLYDATANVLQSSSADTVTLDNEQAAIKRSLGWYVDLESTGEKGLSSPVVLDGKVYFTTFVPPVGISGSACSVSEGTARLYVVDVLTGGAAENLSEGGDDGTDGKFDKADRFQDIGVGIPSGALPLFQEDGTTMIIGASGNIVAHQTGFTPEPELIYWVEE